MNNRKPNPVECINLATAGRCCGATLNGNKARDLAHGTPQVRTALQLLRICESFLHLQQGIIARSFPCVPALASYTHGVFRRLEELE
ncbi:hypothetical protein [Caballeronia grimmiae]|uniref:hypothetical protein n=1 Tax=Caballeronia grimmiae TaxID=1071679 RepID=UPI0038BC6574